MLITDARGRLRYAKPRHILDAARYVIRDELAPRTYFGGPWATGPLIAVHLGKREREAFVAFYLDGQHRLIEARELFHGTVDRCEVQPREVARAALELNSVAVVIAHNHPSGSTKPSLADEILTRRIRDVCEVIGIELLDHVVVGGGEYVSMADRGLGGFPLAAASPGHRRKRKPRRGAEAAHA
jgi:DNA repair protein RadC